MRKRLLFVFSLLFFLLHPVSVSALSVTISDPPDNITDESFTLNVSVSGASPATNYLRVNLFPTGTTHYFGYTYNGIIYVNSSDYSQYLPITIDSSGNWSGTISAKIDTNSSYYSGPGTYSLKVRRYTQSGSSYTWSNELAVNIVVPTPTPTPTPSPIPTPVPTPTPTPVKTPSPSPKKTSSPTSSPTISPTLTPHLTPTPASKLKEQVRSSGNKITRTASVAAVTITASPSATSSPPTNPLIWLGITLILLGAGSIGYIYKKRK